MLIARCIEPKEMSLSSQTTFCKTATCPSSESLLRYHRHELSLSDRMTIEIHLRTCDFCNAELQLLKRYRGDVSATHVMEMPSSVRRLAEQLLAKSARRFLNGSDLTKAQLLSH